jgi:hypothetical protein
MALDRWQRIQGGAYPQTAQRIVRLPVVGHFVTGVSPQPSAQLQNKRGRPTVARLFQQELP